MWRHAVGIMQPSTKPPPTRSFVQTWWKIVHCKFLVAIFRLPPVIPTPQPLGSSVKYADIYANTARK
jgi:hypothetical protein